MTDDNNNARLPVPKHPPWSEGLLLAFASASGYLTAFAFEAGVATAYGIPFQLIELRLTTIFTALASTLGALYVLPSVLDLVSMISWQPRGPIGRALAPIVPLGVLWLAFASVLGRDLWRVSLWIAALILFIPTFSLTFPLLAFREIQGYRAKLDASAQVDAEFGKRAMAQRAIVAYPRVTVLGLLLVVWLLLAATAGYSRAHQAERFFTLPAQPEMIVLRFYGDKVVLGSADRLHHRIRRQYRVLPFPADLQLREETLGRFVLEPLPPSNALGKPVAPTHQAVGVRSLKSSPPPTPAPAHQP
jgi:hypothetical protein